jgi:hypothetical protein
MAREFKVGDTVSVCEFRYRGKVVVPAFIGEITFKEQAGDGTMYYRVRAPDGRRWHRTAREITPVGDNDNTPPVEATQQCG